MKRSHLFILVISLCTRAGAQHCPYDGSAFMVLDIRNKTTHAPVKDLVIYLADKDSIEYYRNSYTYTKETRYPLVSSTYQTFLYVTDKVFAEAKEAAWPLPESLLHKYILWVQPATYRNIFPHNKKLKRYLEDMALLRVINDDHLIERYYAIPFSEDVLLEGCVSSPVWSGNVSFQTVYLEEKLLTRVEKTSGH